MKMPFYEEITMNSPFSGFCTGFHIGMEVRPIPSDFSVVPHKWCKSNWWYIGNGMDEPIGGTCGTVILDKEGKAVSFSNGYRCKSQDLQPALRRPPLRIGDITSSVCRFLISIQIILRYFLVLKSTFANNHRYISIACISMTASRAPIRKPLRERLNTTDSLFCV